MIKSLEINKLLYDRLKSIPELGNRLFPIVAENGTNYPFLVYSRDSLYSSICKDGLYEDSVSFTINIVADTYAVGISIAQRVREIIQVSVLSNTDIKLTNIQLSGASESYDTDSYVQTLQFTATINQI